MPQVGEIVGLCRKSVFEDMTPLSRDLLSISSSFLSIALQRHMTPKTYEDGKHRRASRLDTGGIYSPPILRH